MKLTAHYCMNYYDASQFTGGQGRQSPKPGCGKVLQQPMNILSRALRSTGFRMPNHAKEGNYE